MTQTTADAYLAAVDTGMAKRHALTYTELVEVAPCLDKDNALVKGAMARDWSPDKFCESFAQVHSLKGMNHGTPRQVASVNKKIAAIAEFAGVPGWHLGTDGNAYSGVSGAGVRRILRLEPERSDAKSESFGWSGFGVSESDGFLPFQTISNDRWKRVVPPELDFAPIAGGSDIGETILKARVMSATAGGPGRQATVPSAEQPPAPRV